MTYPRSKIADHQVVSDPSKAAVSLFMWASGSMFDLIMNAFTNDPAHMIPAPGNGNVLNQTLTDFLASE